MSDNYTFEIVSPKYGQFVVTAPLRFKSDIESKRWHIARDSHRAVGHQFEVRTHDRKGKVVRLHGFIWALMGRDPAKELDHVDRNPMNNAEENLRDGSGTNSRNRTRQRNNTSGHAGVTWYARTEKWKVSVRANRIRHHIGYFTSFTDAALARDAAARELHGAFAVRGDAS